MNSEDEQYSGLWKASLANQLTLKGAKPAFCVQGGGARGAWEAGVIAEMLKGGPNTTPSSIWGTSAGALNAFWTRDKLVRENPEVLLEYWLKLARRVLPIAVFFSAIALACIVCLAYLLWVTPCQARLALVETSGVGIFVLVILAQLRVLKRLPGLLPAKLIRLIVPSASAIVPGASIYTCVSDINSEKRPELWDRTRRNWFLIESDASTCVAKEMSSYEDVDAFHVAVASASLPGLVRPVQILGSTLLDGGLVANLPAGFIATNGAAGGAYVLCVIPYDVKTLKSADPIDYRTLKFLFDLKAEQAEHRKEASTAVSSVVAAHTHIPIFIISPKTSLKSGIGLFLPCLLRREFSQAMSEAKAFCSALEAFEKGDGDSLSDYLLENVLKGCRAPGEPPALNLWYWWVNLNW